MRLRIYCVLAILLPVATCFCQNDPNKIHPLTIGDTIPAYLELHNVYNYPVSKIRLSALKGKLIILDFWSTTCSSCIEGFSNLEALQNKFGDKIQILLVNPVRTKYDNESRIKQTIHNFKTRTGSALSLPVPLFDSILNNYFPHASNPHEVWIDEQGRIIGITEARYVTADNIAAHLVGEKLNMPLKNELEFNKDLPLLVNGNGGGEEDVVFRSQISRYSKSIRYSSVWRTDQHQYIIGFLFGNQSRMSMIKMAFKDIMDSVSNNRIVLDVNKPEFYTDESDIRYNYDLTIPPTTAILFSKELPSYLKSDLKKAFNITVVNENRKIKCFVLNRTERLSKSFTKFKSKDGELNEENPHKYLHHFSVQELSACLGGWLPHPLVDETETTEYIDLNFSDGFELSDSAGILRALNDAGFKVKEEQKELKVVVISDK